MKPRKSKSYVNMVWFVSVGIFILMGCANYSYALTEKLEVNLFTCPISSSQRHEQIVIKDVTVNENHGSYQYYVVDVEAGNFNGAVNGEGQHLKYIQTLLTTQNAHRDTFYRSYGDNFYFEMDFIGHSRDSRVKVFLDKKYNGKYVLSLSGAGPLYFELMQDYQDVLSQSEFYSSHAQVECFIHPQIDRYVTH